MRKHAKGVIMNRKNLSKILYSALTLISPRLNTAVAYKRSHKKRINLKNPQTLEEKLSWLKLYSYNNSESVIRCADKYAVREYIQNKGLGNILNDIIGVYDNANEIPWDDLPNKFVLKWNFGAGMNIICTDKSQLDIDSTVEKLNKWQKCKYWLSNSEMHYKKIPKKIICEAFLEQNDKESLTDYKVYCFNSIPTAILVINDRGGTVKGEFFDIEWNELQSNNKYPKPTNKTEKPKCLDQIINASRVLSEEFPFVRCDFYVINDKLYFGELTFTPAGGLHLSKAIINGKEMTEYLSIENEMRQKGR